MTNYFVSKNGRQLGPWTKAEISDLLVQGEVLATDLIFDSLTSEWLPIENHVSFEKLVKNLSPLHAAQSPSLYAVLNHDQLQDLSQMELPRGREWYYKVNTFSTDQGPFTYLEMLRFLQVGTVRFDHQVFHPVDKKWNVISEMKEFKPEIIKAVMSSRELEPREVFLRRTFSRIPYSSAFLVHDSKLTSQVLGHELSPAGIGFKVDQKFFDLGQSLFLHLKDTALVPGFNAIGVVMNQRAIGNEYLYGLKFKNISTSVQQNLMQFYSEHQKSLKKAS